MCVCEREREIEIVLQSLTVKRVVLLVTFSMFCFARFKEEKALWEKALLESSPSSLLTSSMSSGGEHVRYSTDVPVAAADTVNSADIEGSVSAATSGMSAGDVVGR